MTGDRMTGDRMTAAEVLDLGRVWIARGIPSFPIAVAWDDTKGGTDKRPLTEHGHHDATLDPAEFEQMVNARSPRPGEVWGLGLHPGPAGYAVVDVDVKNDAGGDDAWADLQAAHAPVDSYTVMTASGGWHVWGGKGAARVGNEHRLGEGIDLRADRGWVVAAGTRTPWGRWERESSTSWPPAPWPSWVLDRLDTTASDTPGRVGRWHDLDRDSLEPADLAALEALEQLGGHDPYIGSDGTVMVVRPGKRAGGSASIGYVAPGVVKVFSSNWPPLQAGARYDADQLARLATGDNATEPSDSPTGLMLTPASTIAVARPEWVWEGRIPIGGTTLGAGREGLGKTALGCWVMARLTRGQLPGRWHGTPADVVYIGTEDDRSSVLVPRLIAAGADLTRVQFVDVPRGATFSVSADSGALADTLAGRDVALVILDPLDGHMGGVDSHRKAEVQAAVAKLAVLAQELRCGTWGLGHLNKGDVRDILARVVGSVGFTTSVRSVLGIGEHPDDPADRVCVVAKANMTDKAAVPAVRFRVEGALIDDPTGGPSIDTGLAVMLGEETGIDPDSVIDRGSPAERAQREQDADWLADVLSDGPMLLADLTKLARAEGLDKTRLRRAREAAGVEVTRNPNERGRPSIWSLRAFDSPPPTVAADYGSRVSDPKPPDPYSIPSLTSGNGQSDLITGQSPGSDPKPRTHDGLDPRVDHDEW